MSSTKITFTRDVPGKRPRKIGDTADYRDEVAQQLIAAGVAKVADESETTAKTKKAKSKP